MGKAKFCVAIKKLRKARGLTAEELADKVGVDRTYISKMENGRLLPSIRIIIDISKHLGPSDCYDLYFQERYPELRRVFK